MYTGTDTSKKLMCDENDNFLKKTIACEFSTFICIWHKCIDKTKFWFLQMSLLINIDSSMVSEDFDLAYRSILPLEVYGDKDKPFSPAHCREALQVLDLQKILLVIHL